MLFKMLKIQWLQGAGSWVYTHSNGATGVNEQYFSFFSHH